VRKNNFGSSWFRPRAKYTEIVENGGPGESAPGYIACKQIPLANPMLAWVSSSYTQRLTQCSQNEIADNRPVCGVASVESWLRPRGPSSPVLDQHFRDTFSAAVPIDSSNYSTRFKFQHENRNDVSGGKLMAKRFTDTDKWKKPWFRGLSHHAKIVWFYLCDQCDHAGIWPADFSLISFQVGFKVTPENLEMWLGDRVFKVTEDKYFLPSFFEFQYGHVKTGFRARLAAIEKLRELDLVDEQDRVRDLTDSQGHLPKCASNSNSNSNSVSIKGGVGENFKFLKDLEEIYKEYPRKEGKGPGMKSLVRDIKSVEDLEAFRQAVQKYKQHCKEKKKEGEFIKMFSTFANNWRECLEPDWGTTENFAVGQNFSEKFKGVFDAND
jgi:hypothetical protein